MLVLTFREDEGATLRHRSGDVLRVEVVGAGGQVRIGFEGPREEFEVIRDNAKVKHSRFAPGGSVTEAPLSGYLPSSESCL